MAGAGLPLRFPRLLTPKRTGGRRRRLAQVGGQYLLLPVIASRKCTGDGGAPFSGLSQANWPPQASAPCLCRARGGVRWPRGPRPALARWASALGNSSPGPVLLAPGQTCSCIFPSEDDDGGVKSTSSSRVETHGQADVIPKRRPLDVTASDLGISKDGFQIHLPNWLETAVLTAWPHA